MTSSADSAAAGRQSWMSFALGRVIAGAKRAGRRPPVVAAAVLVAAGGITAGALALNPSNAARSAAACPAPGPPYYAYAIPEDPAHPPAAASGPTSWGWMPRVHQIKVGDRVRVGKHLWQVTGIRTMPGVERMCRPFGIWGLPAGSPFEKGLVMAGRLVLQPVG